MALFVLSTDGGSREDASVFYARYLEVDVPAGDEPLVDAALQGLLGLSTHMDFEEDDDADADALYEDLPQLIEELKLLGFTARVVNPTLIIQNC